MPRPLMCDRSLFDQDLSGRRYVVTGANSGIGLVAVRQLVMQGAEAILGCRRLEEGERCAQELAAEQGSARALRLDLGDLASVREFAGQVRALGPLDGLVNNAGVMNTPQQKTKDGFEFQLGVNHLGHVLLTELLLASLKQAASERGEARVVNVSSCFHDVAMGRQGEVHLDDLFFERERKYDGWASYAQSKLANVLHAQKLAQELEGSGVIAVSLHPGWVRTRLARHTMPLWAQDYLLRPLMRLMGMIEPWEGTQTTLHALLAPEVKEHSGAFFSQIGDYRDRSCNKGGWPLRSPNPQVHDEAIRDGLWDKSRELVGLGAAAEAS